jgi:hypothetical protein
MIEMRSGVCPMHLNRGEAMSLRMIILLGIFVWAPIMAFLVWKYLQTFGTTVGASRRRERRPMVAEVDKHAIPDDSRRRIYRRS